MIICNDSIQRRSNGTRQELTELPRAVDQPHVYLPTCEQIAAECQRIRNEWSRNEQHRRRAGATKSDYSEHEPE